MQKPNWVRDINTVRRKMKNFSAVLFALVAFGVSGCVIYLDDPPKRKISGQVVRDDTGAPIANARVWFCSGRKPFSLLPVDTFGIDASAVTDKDGRISVTAKLKDKVEVRIQNDEFWERFELPPFPASNQLDGAVWRLKEKKPNQPVQPTPGTGSVSNLESPARRG